MKSKRYSVYRMKDQRGSDGYMYHAEGPAIREALLAGRIIPNDTWDLTQVGLVTKLQMKGV